MTTINGIPAHALLVHAVVVLVPLTAVLIVLIALWSTARRNLAGATAVLAAVTLISVPLTTDAGSWLKHHVPATPLVQAHAHLGDDMLPWAIALFVVAAAIAVRQVLANRSTDRRQLGGPVLTVLIAVVALVVAAGSVTEVYLIGESGARAAWTGHFSPTPLSGR
jgi:hypothetical protein